MKRTSGQALVLALLVCFVAVVLRFAIQREPGGVAPPDSPPAITNPPRLRGTRVPLPQATTFQPDSASPIQLPAQAAEPTLSVTRFALSAPDAGAGASVGRWRVWVPYRASAVDAPMLRAFAPGAGAFRQQLPVPEVDLGLRPGFPGPSLYRLHPSPDRRLLVADIAYGEQVYPLVLDVSRSLVYTLPGEQPYFYAWHPDSRRVLLSAVEGWLLADVISGRYEPFALFEAMGESLPVRALAYSPDGQSLADALVYPPTLAEPAARIDVGLWRDGQRTSLLRLSGGSMLAEHSLRWSPDGRALAFVADVHRGERQTQLWTIDVRAGASRMLGMLAQDVQYNEPPAWSPDGGRIAAIAQGDGGAGAIALFDARDGSRRDIQPRASGALSHVSWSTDGRWMLFSLARGEHGEVWMTSPDGARQQAIAGPMPAGAPFAVVEGQ